jgi:hypothetical protein
MIPWTDSVRKTGKLTIYAGGLAGDWSHAFKQALQEFNNLSKSHKLGVTFTEAKSNDKDDANVFVQTANGPVSASYEDQTKSEQFDGIRLHGQTLLFWRDPGNVVEKSFIFLPSQPIVNTPEKTRPVGTGVLKVIAAHELIHACGLDNDDHAGDLFQANPTVSMGNSAAGDKVLVGKGPKAMPPLVIDGATMKKIQDLWT